MLQTIDGQEVYVVDFDTMPELPITWETEEEEPYARALARAIHEKQITEPGKYGIAVAAFTYPGAEPVYNVYSIIEE